MHAVPAHGDEAHAPRAYGLAPAQLHEQTRRLLRQHPARGAGRFVAYRIAGVSDYSDIARSVECEVFQRFFGNTPAQMHEAYGEYEPHSLFFLAVDRELQLPAGTLRVIAHSPYGLKSLNDIQAEPLSVPLPRVLDYHGIADLERCWDVGTLAVRKPYRGGDNAHFVGTMLYGLFHASALRAGIEHAVAILDGHAYRQLTELLGVPFEPIAATAPFDYLGSKGSRAAYLRLPSVVPTVEEFMRRLDGPTLAALRPLLARVIYAEGLPELQDVA